ncbi:hypothetical protein DPMN_010519 [Dreissena polymorpha]|uniref:Uncharacterized protein n=1 Tax=Dreissena polymorpha TaxID=45954 RepID=A0A9D4N270_DREPO|nr:hypothetical protein DPMN_010519 [Dreissena polymorpha]
MQTLKTGNGQSNNMKAKSVKYIAVRAESDEFFLLEAKSTPFILTLDTTDDY